MIFQGPLPEGLAELLQLERRMEQEWWWINGALHAVAQLQAEGPKAIRELDAQAREIDRMRVKIAARLTRQPPPPPESGPTRYAPREPL
jgi:DNA repair ATPase RecN